MVATAVAGFGLSLSACKGAADSGMPAMPDAEQQSRTEAPARIKSSAGLFAPSAECAAELSTDASFAAEVIRLVNEERAKTGAGALTNQAQLANAAQTHSNDQACNAADGLSPTHTGTTIPAMSDRMTAAGYSWSNVGENVAAAQTTPAEVMTSWMNSPGHKANILNPEFTEMGVGYAKRTPAGKDPYYYWTQKFAKPMN